MFQIDRDVLFGNSVVGKQKPESDIRSDSGFSYVGHGIKLTGCKFLYVPS